MTEISDSLRLLYETALEEREDEYVHTLPKEPVENSSLTNDIVYRVALLESASESRQSKLDPSETTHGRPSPPMNNGLSHRTHQSKLVASGR
ncbi:hypothetical protein RH831_11330 [Halodesulfurarchaeum sp. HSR-GB]|uniref:hypothetical protein n=1 Tax=Halodesulfurarchaeum sp. HSR-GB TaxID=3074077 RepID=UPI0028633AE2|nr:hypothetical protein [Halodesulfurarchaeum sp. HSR-GB]MDR5657767.1 hypothetical protein [Halodesulfurarchaeum sp. HSR-GB]